MASFYYAQVHLDQRMLSIFFALFLLCLFKMTLQSCTWVVISKRYGCKEFLKSHECAPDDVNLRSLDGFFFIRYFRKWFWTKSWRFSILQAEFCITLYLNNNNKNRNLSYKGELFINICMTNRFNNFLSNVFPVTFFR